jgi:integrase/recombinase XerD
LDKYDILLLKFIEYLKVNGFAERSIPGYAHNVKLFLDYLKSLGINNITAADRRVLADYQTKVYLETHRGKPLAPFTQQFRIVSLRAFYRYLLKAGAVLYDPTADLTLPQPPNQLPKGILSKKEIGDLFSSPDLETPLGVRDRAILELLYSTGIRASELCNLVLNDLNLCDRELRINQGKGRKDRIVPLGELACDFLEIYLREARPKLAASDQTLLFVSKSGRRLTRGSLEDLVQKHAQKAGLKKKLSPHSLRHTCATHLLKGKADIRQIQKLLGHSTIESTQVYTRVEITDLKQVLKRCHPRERREIETNDF